MVETGCEQDGEMVDSRPGGEICMLGESSSEEVDSEAVVEDCG